METAEEAITRRVAEARVWVRQYAVRAAVTTSKVRIRVAVGYAAVRSALPRRLR